MDIEKQFKQLADGIKEQVLEQVRTEIDRVLEDSIQAQASKFDDIAIAAVMKVVAQRLKNVDFSPGSVPASAINTSTTKISGDAISGGIISNFGSTGIDDRATDCKITILDNATVVENTLVAGAAKINADLVVDGTLTINGYLDKETGVYKDMIEDCSTAVLNRLDTSLFDRYSSVISEKINQSGIDLKKITVDGKTIVDGNALSSTITHSNLTRLGSLTELRVTGEMLVAETLYTSKRRVGINTMEPSSALSIWDEEVEISLGKKRKDIALIGVPRAQRLLLSSNNKENLSLELDGSVTVQKLNIGQMSFTSAAAAPNYESTKGTVVFNANPNLGGPMGWICLGGSKWANFGIID